MVSELICSAADSAKPMLKVYYLLRDLSMREMSGSLGSRVNWPVFKMNGIFYAMSFLFVLCVGV